MHGKLKYKIQYKILPEGLASVIIWTRSVSGDTNTALVSAHCCVSLTAQVNGRYISTCIAAIFLHKECIFNHKVKGQSDLSSVLQKESLWLPEIKKFN